MSCEPSEDNVKLFVRQVLQLVPAKDVSWPASEDLRPVSNQRFIFVRCFDTTRPRTLGPSRYRYLILKLLVKKIENAIVDPEEDEISDELVDALSELMSEEMPSELEAAQQRSWVTYSTIIADKENDISILENRSVISGSGTTGLRTWEAALHLGSYLLSSPEAANYILGKQVVELGAGSGFISILCAKVLRASGVVATDGSPEVVATLKTNVEANQCDDKVSTGVLRWGWHLQETVLDSASLQENVHTVLGADVTYDQSVIPALVSTIRHVFERWPSANVIISATIRNEATFASFERACGHNKFSLSTVDYPVRPLEEQQYLFHSASTPIKILHIRAPSSIRDPFHLN